MNFLVGAALIFATVAGQKYRFALGGGGNILWTDIIAALFYISVFIKLYVVKSNNPNYNTGFAKLIPLFTATTGFFLIALISNLAGFITVADIGLSSTKEAITSFMYLGRMALYLFLPFIVFLSFTLESEKWQERYKSLSIWVMGLTTAWIAILGFRQLIRHPDFTDMAIKAGWDPHIDRLLSTWFDPNFIAAFFSMILCVLFAVFIDKKLYVFKSLFWQRIALAIPMITILIANFLTYSRTGYLSLVLGIAIIGIVKARTLFITLAVIATIATLSNPRAVDRISGAFNIDATASKRIESWTTAYTIVDRFPFLGVGYNHLGPYQIANSFVDEYDVNNRYGFENTYLTFAATTGYIGLTAYFIYLGYLLFYLFYHSRHSTLALGCLAAQISLMASAMFINALLYAHILVFQAFIIVLALLERKNKSA